MEALTCEAMGAVERFRPFIVRFARGLNLREHDEEDIMNVAREVAWKAAPKFRDDRGKKFDGFLVDCVKRRLLDIYQFERRQCRAPWFNRVGLTGEEQGAAVGAEVVVFEDMVDSLSGDAATVVRLLGLGYETGDLVEAGIPIRFVEQARTEVACRLVEEGRMELRHYLEERAKELQLVPLPQPDETDEALAARILARFARRHRLRVVPAPAGPSEEEGERPRIAPLIVATETTEAGVGAFTGAKPCARRGCEGRAAPGEDFCSISCAAAELAEARSIRAAERQMPEGDLAVRGYTGTASPESVEALVNPFPPASASYWLFEVWREASRTGPGISRQDAADQLMALCKEHRIRLKVPMQRVRRTVTEVRRLGFELLKDDGGRFKFTGRRVS